MTTISAAVKWTEAELPWNGLPVRMTGNLHAYFAERLPKAMRRYLPHSITLCWDREVLAPVVSEFLFEAGCQLESEFCRRTARRNRMVELGLFSEAEIEAFLTGRCHLQPWMIYYSKDGGLREALFEPAASNPANGVIPCSSMKNHGVAWAHSPDRELQAWLATARKEGCDWDWGSDIGHESAHAAFAPIPLFAQDVQQRADSAEFSSLNCVEDLTSSHLARMAYLYSEIAVVAVRGETRPTETGLPVARRADLHSLLKLSHELMPRAGFKQALGACSHTNGSIDVDQGDEIFEIAAPVMRVIPYLTELTKSFSPPTLAWYRMINSRI